MNVLYAVWKEYAYTSEIIWTVDGNMISSNGSFLKTDSESTYGMVYGGNTAMISASWLSVLASSGMGLYTEMTYGNIMFDSDCVSTFASVGKDVTFSIKPVTSSGTETFSVKSGDDVVVTYNITASYYNDSSEKTCIHDLNGTATVTVINMSGGNSVVYVGDDGTQPSSISYTEDTITFETTHFSLYEIVEADDGTHSEPLPLILAIGTAASALTAAAGALYVARRGH